MSNDNSKSNSFDKFIMKGGDSDNCDFIPGDAILAQPLEVKVYNNNFDKALRAFRALVQKERVLSVYKEKQSYEKPSQRRRRKSNESRRKLMETSRGERPHRPKKQPPNSALDKGDESQSE